MLAKQLLLSAVLGLAVAGVALAQEAQPDPVMTPDQGTTTTDPGTTGGDGGNVVVNPPPTQGEGDVVVNNPPGDGADAGLFGLGVFGWLLLILVIVAVIAIIAAAAGGHRHL